MDKLTLDISTNKVTTSKMSDDEIKNLTSLSELEIKFEPIKPAPPVTNIVKI